MFILVTLFLPRGVMGLFDKRIRKQAEAETPAAGAAQEVTG
jgi:hypothetical protein